MINYLPPSLMEFGEYLVQLFPEKIKKTINITFQVTEDCCMACTYCYQHHKTNNKMDWKTAKEIIDKLLSNKIDNVHSDNVSAIIIEFIGGEPLMEIDLIEQICEYTIKQMIQLNHPWLYYLRFSICSNGLLYDTPKVQSFFQKYNNFISFTISVDGNQELHDSCRIDINGNKTYNKVINAVNLFYNQYDNIKETKMTFAPNNIHFVEKAIINLINESYTIISCNCIFEKGWNYSHAQLFYSELKKIADYLIFNNLYNKISIRLFDENYYQPMLETDNNNWCGGVGMQSMAFDYCGNIYPCVRYMESSLNKRQKSIKVGNIHTGYLSNAEEKENLDLISNITRRSQSTDECFYCPIAAGCAWCSAYNYEEFGTPNKRATYICCMHKAQSLANVYYWNTLYKYLNINKKFKMYLPKEEALKIIDKNEYNYLLQLSKE